MKNKGVAYYKKKLDKIFSQFIRLKETNQGWGRCVTCGKLKPFGELDCGHFISRRYTKFRWSEENAHIQCRYCNRFGGEIDSYYLWMVKKYGQKKVEQMIKEKNETIKLNIDWLKKEIEKYKNKIKKLST